MKSYVGKKVEGTKAKGDCAQETNGYTHESFFTCFDSTCRSDTVCDLSCKLKNIMLGGFHMLLLYRSRLNSYNGF